MIKHITFLFVLFFAFNLNAKEISTYETMDLAHGDTSTNCASTLFSNALVEHANEINQDTPEAAVRVWAHKTINTADVLRQVLECPEIKSVSDTTTITFTPIVYKFDNGRTITINYSTQPRVLKQKLILASKPSLPNGDVNPRLMDPNDAAKYLNTEPAWYGILVVQHDSLKDFVGPDKNNTLSIKYINDNIKSIYPHGYFCTSKSAIANDADTINNVVKQVVNVEDDSNDYYVAGDINLEWIMYAEIAADIIITVATMGGGELALIGLKGLNASKNAKNLIKSIKTLETLDDVQNYIKATREIATHTDDIAKLEKSLKGVKTAKEADKIKDEINTIRKTLKETEEIAETMVKNSKNVKQFVDQSKIFEEVMKYRRALTAFRRPQTGNVIVRNLKGITKTLKAANTGAKTLNKAGRVARAGMSSRSAKIGDWLLSQTYKHGARLAKFERNTGALYAGIKFLGDMYDRTSTTSKEFSNGIEFKPFCLLSADDIKGSENVVNYGMWLMFLGNSTDAADDDAAYLQAMDFASKLNYQLHEYQEELPLIKMVNILGIWQPYPRNSFLCNVDIYVVRPIIRLDESNMNDPHGELFYLFMNDIPWTTADQFDEMVDDVEDWERNQTELTEQDPNYKYHKKPEEENLTETVEGNEQQTE